MAGLIVLGLIIGMAVTFAVAGAVHDETNAYYTQQQKRYTDEMYRRNRTRGPYA